MRNFGRIRELSKKITQLDSIVDDNIYLDDPIVTVEKLLSLGGIMAGGSVLSLYFNKPYRDIDFFFNDENAYKEAKRIICPKIHIDVCFYFDTPYEFFDLSPAMCTFNGTYVFSDKAKKAIDLNTGEIIFDNLFAPDKTLNRICKYQDKYGFKFNEDHIIIIKSLTETQHEH